MSMDLSADPRWIKLASTVASRWGRKFPKLRDEFESASHLALVQIARKFDDRRGTDFGRHLEARLGLAMVDVQRSWRPLGFQRRGGEATPNVYSISSPVPVSASKPDEFDDAAVLCETGELAVGWEAEYHDQLETLVAGLPDREAAVIRLIYGRADTALLRQAGERMGVKMMRASQIHSRAIELLRIQFKQPVCLAC